MTGSELAVGDKRGMIGTVKISILGSSLVISAGAPAAMLFVPTLRENYSSNLSNQFLRHLRPPCKG